MKPVYPQMLKMALVFVSNGAQVHTAIEKTLEHFSDADLVQAGRLKKEMAEMFPTKK